MSLHDSFGSHLIRSRFVCSPTLLSNYIRNSYFITWLVKQINELELHWCRSKNLTEYLSRVKIHLMDPSRGCKDMTFYPFQRNICIPDQINNLVWSFMTMTQWRRLNELFVLTWQWQKVRNDNHLSASPHLLLRHFITWRQWLQWSGDFSTDWDHYVVTAF